MASYFSDHGVSSGNKMSQKKFVCHDCGQNTIARIIGDDEYQCARCSSRMVEEVKEEISPLERRRRRNKRRENRIKKQQGIEVKEEDDTPKKEVKQNKVESTTTTTTTTTTGQNGFNSNSGDSGIWGSEGVDPSNLMGLMMMGMGNGIFSTQSNDNDMTSILNLLNGTTTTTTTGEGEGEVDGEEEGEGDGEQQPVNMMNMIQHLMAQLNLNVSGDVAQGEGDMERIMADLYEQASQAAKNKDRGASKEAIESLEVIEVEKDSPALEEECSVCKDQFSVGEQMKKLPCGHLYHPECVEMWLKTNNTCPLCRFELEQKSEEEKEKTADEIVEVVEETKKEGEGEENEDDDPLSMYA